MAQAGLMLLWSNAPNQTLCQCGT